ncbi:protein phosphatase 2C domain-containing protein [Streptomyces alkaliphilus]|uniref:protein phosphatase 2C domain-containing protein n=1 Tax=Streptomyces alkaliphilus TaxID=1472722 RepID=UPI0011815761|nr:protein phosphatase 2C domain-containing protein [Streptomyces alkaliphilus]MQS06763.1 hypothetical protein [Streptomyces alkaliphilus]
MHVRAAVRPAGPSRPCEDFAAALSTGDGGALVVLDGVTPPVGGDGCSHGVPWFVNRLGGALLEAAARRPEVPLTECLARAITRVAAAHRATCDLSHPRTPQATVVLARWSERTVEHLVLCDSVLLIRDPEGGVRPVHDARLETCRARARERVAAERVAFLEGLRNAPDGFPTAAADPTVADLALAGTTSRKRVSALAALTDGATRWTDTFALGDWTALFDLLLTGGPERLLEEVRGAEAADPTCRAFPRGKASDDAAAVIVAP